MPPVRTLVSLEGIVLAASLSTATCALAEPVSVKDARAQLFSTRGTEVRVTPQPFLSEQDVAILLEIGKDQPYYGVIAMSPDQGLLSTATLAAARYHGIEAARIAALAACDEKREKGSAKCAAVAEILPRDHAPRDLQLSVEATEVFNKSFRRKRGEKAFAISEATGQWGFALDQGAAEAALADCAAKAAEQGANDCRIVIAE